MRTKITHRNGFSVIDFMMAKGESRVYTFNQQTSRYNDIDTCGLYVSGRFQLTDPSGKVIAERLPGTFTEDRPDLIEPGEYTFTAMEDYSRWFCVSSKADFDCCKLELGQDQVHTMPPGQMFLLCSGELVQTPPGTPAKPGNFLVNEITPVVLKGVAPTSLGILLWR